MARPASTEARTSVYHVTGLVTLDAAVQSKYRKKDGFTSVRVEVGSRSGLLISGKTEGKDVSWAPVLRGLTSEQIDLSNVTAAAVLIIPVAKKSKIPAVEKIAQKVAFVETNTGQVPSTDAPDEDNVDLTLNDEKRLEPEAAWVLTYGMGFQLLDQDRVDTGFGQRIAIRSANPKDLNSVTRVTLDERSRVERSTIPAGAHLRGFGLGDLGELVTRLVASAKIPGLSSGDKVIKVRGADALSIPLSKNPATLLKDLKVIEKLQDKPPASRELGFLEQLALVKDQELITLLDGLLLQAIGEPENPLLALSWPHEKIDENGTPSSFKLMGFGRSEPQDDVPTLPSILTPIRAVSTNERQQQLERTAVMLFRDSDGKDPISPRIPARRWLAFQAEVDDRRFNLHDGKWYAMEKSYAEQVKERTAEIFELGPGVSKIPNWPASASDEASYNTLLAQELGGVCLDRKLMRSDFHKHGIEACDVLLEDGTFIHVKNIESSSPASHLLAQALVSTEVLTFDKVAQQDFRKKVKKAGWDPKKYSGRPKRVVLVVARRGATITPDSLFTFTQVNLSRQVAQLGAQGVEVFIAPIERASAEQK